MKCLKLSNYYPKLLGLPLSKMMNETLWIFCPKNQTLKFLQYYLAQIPRPDALVLMMQHQGLPMCYNLLMSQQQSKKVYIGCGELRRPQTSREIHQDFIFPGRIHIFYLPVVYG